MNFILLQIYDFLYHGGTVINQIERVLFSDLISTVNGQP